MEHTAEVVAWRAATLSALARLAGGACIAAIGLGAALMLAWPRAAWDERIADAAIIAGFCAFPAVGALIAARRPANPIGWLMLASSVGWAVTMLATGYAHAGLLGGRAWPGARVAAALIPPAGAAALAVAATGVPLFFPTGRLLSRRWRPAVWLAAAGTPLLVLGVAIAPGPIADGDFSSVQNPLGIDGAGTASDLMGATGYAMVMAAFLAGLAALGLRLMRSPGAEREQVKWLALAAALGAASVIAVKVVGGTRAMTFHALTITLLPVAVGIAVLRHRLLDIDLLIRRSVVYGVLWAAITAGYVAFAAASGIAAGSRVSVQFAVVMTIAATLVFQPARHRLEAVADRWVFGERPPGTVVMAGFGARLEEAPAPADLASELASAVRRGLALEWVRVTLDGATESVAGQGAAAPVLTVPIVRRGTRLGTIECGPKDAGPFAEADYDLLAGLAGQTALAAELAESRGRLAGAHDAERRRIERNLHDGVQQEVAALLAKLRLARNRLSRGDATIDPMLAELHQDVLALLANLRELAQGIHPSVLTDRGLVAAIDDRLVRLPIPVTLHADTGMRSCRYADDIEVAAYFAVSEALANALKYAGAGRVDVALRESGGRLRAEVRDDGIGFDPASTTGTGLVNLADRIQVVGGRLEVSSIPGSGTLVRADLPARAARAQRG